MKRKMLLLAAVVAMSLPLGAGENLKINPRLDYNSDSGDGPLITGDRMEEGAAAGLPNYVIIYGEG